MNRWEAARRVDADKYSGFRVAAAMALLVVGTLFACPGGAYEERSPEPTADYPTFEAARDSIGAMIERVVRSTAHAHGSAIQLSRVKSRFKYWYAGDSTDSWEFRIVVTDSSECPMTRLEYVLGEAGWTAHPAYIADGPDGGVMGFVSKRHFCVVEGHWDGGDDSDSTYVPEPGCQVTVTCVVRRMDDVPR